MIYAVDAVCLLVSVIVSVARGSKRSYWGCLAVTSTLAAAWWVLDWSRDGIALEAGSAVFALLMWWWRGKGRRRVLKVLGGKWRRVRDRMVRTLQDRRRARPVLAPEAS